MTDRVLIVEDDAGLVMALTDLLCSEGYEVESARDGHVGLERATLSAFDLIILDVMLPGKSGFDVCRDLRQRGIATPILMLTARGQVIDKVLGLKLGADDYLTKPFEPLELLARLEALLRRRQTSAPSERVDETFGFGSVLVDFRSTEVRCNEKIVELSAREFQLLRYFITKRGATLSRGQLLREVWGYSAAVVTRTVDTRIAELRRKLEAHGPRLIQTLRNRGYRFGDAEDA